MKRFALLSLVALAAAAPVAGCGAPDVSIAQNGDAGTSSQHSGGKSSVNKNAGGSASSAGAAATGGQAASGASGGASTSEAGSAGQSVADSGGVAAGGADGAGGETSSGCSGGPPLCFGNDTSKCCGHDPAGVAVCQGDQWMCFGAPAPGCNGDQCTELFSCGPTLKCHRTTDYCTVLSGGIGGDQYQCTPFPQCQPTHSNCACINRPECQICNQDVSGNVFISCQVG